MGLWVVVGRWFGVRVNFRALLKAVRARLRAWFYAFVVFAYIMCRWRLKIKIAFCPMQCVVQRNMRAALVGADGVGKSLQGDPIIKFEVDADGISKLSLKTIEAHFEFLKML